MQTHRYIVTLAGGGGKRLWPLSRVHQPKQLLPFYGTTTLLEKTIERMQDFAPVERQWVVTTQQYASTIQTLLAGRIGKYVIEPLARNTAPAVLLSCLEISKIDPEAIAVFVPADHVIGDQNLFEDAINAACAYAEQYDHLVLLGIKPLYAATEYGYIELGLPASNASSIFSVARFHEKPSSEVAQWYYQHDTMLWNSGIICARVSVLLREFYEHAPSLPAAIDRYEQLSSCSIDYTILEKSNNIAVVRCHFAWSDVGNLATFIAARSYDYQKDQHVALFDASHNKAHTKKMVVFAGVENLCIIETDDVIFVAHQDAIHRSAEIAEYLSEKGFQKYT